MAELNEKILRKTFVEALNEVFGNKDNGNLTGTPIRTSVSDSMINNNSNGYMGRNNLGRFDGSDTFENIFERIKTFNEQSKKVLEHNEKVIKDLKEAYANFSSNLNEEEKTRMRAQVDLEEALYEQDAARKKNITLETENSARYIRIKTKNQEQELELENKRLKFQEENLEKTQAIAKVQQEIELTRKKYELKGYNKNGKKNAGAEFFESLGKVSAYFKGNSAGRVLKDTGSVIGKGAEFAVNNKEMSISDIGKPLANALSIIPGVGGLLGGITNALVGILEAGDKINKKSSEYVKLVGGGYQKMVQMRTQAVATASAISKLGDKAYKFDKILEHTAELSKETGRVMEHMSNTDFKSLEDLRQWGIDSSVLNQFDTFGLSMETIDKRIKSIYNTSGKQGLNAKAVTDVVTKNLKMAQNYTFAGGLRSLERMAQKSVALKYNMESVSRFADKVSTLEGAATAAAQLSVLGGDFARMGNPLTMLYGGLQDVEQLNEMMLNMTKNMAQWDRDKGQMEITAYNRQRLRAAADAMGVDYSELVNQAMTQGKRNRIDNQLDIAGRVNDDTTREYIKNIAQVDEEGKGYVVFHENGGERRVDVDKLTENDKEKLKEESKRYSDEQNAKLGDVLSQTRTITEQLNDLIDTLRAKIATGIITIYNWLDSHFGDGNNQIDISGISLSGNQKVTYDAAIKARDKGWENLSETEKTTLKNAGITNRAQIAGKSNEELSSIASNPIKTETEKKAHGGVIRGKGTSMSDSIPAMLSNGEFVMNAKATNKHLPTLQAWNADGYNSGTITPIRAGGNQTNPLSVKENITNIGNNQTGAQKLAIEPISINVSGTINLTGGGANKSLDIKQLLDNNTFISYLTRQIEKSINFSFNAGESKSHMPYYIPMT